MGAELVGLAARQEVKEPFAISLSSSASSGEDGGDLLVPLLLGVGG